MTLDEAIKHCEEVAELNEECIRIYKDQGDMMASYSCSECASEHRQLADWLRELKAYREGVDKILGDISQYIENAYEHETPYDNGRHDGAIDCYGRIIAEFEDKQSNKV